MAAPKKRAPVHKSKSRKKKAPKRKKSDPVFLVSMTRESWLRPGAMIVGGLLTIFGIRIGVALRG